MHLPGHRFVHMAHLIHTFATFCVDRVHSTRRASHAAGQ